MTSTLIFSSFNLAILSIKAIKFSWQIFLYKSGLWVMDSHSSWCLWIFLISAPLFYYNGSETSKTMRSVFQYTFGYKSQTLNFRNAEGLYLAKSLWWIEDKALTSQVGMQDWFFEYLIPASLPSFIPLIHEWHTRHLCVMTINPFFSLCNTLVSVRTPGCKWQKAKVMT